MGMGEGLSEKTGKFPDITICNKIAFLFKIIIIKKWESMDFKYNGSVRKLKKASSWKWFNLWDYSFTSLPNNLFVHSKYQTSEWLILFRLWIRHYFDGLKGGLGKFIIKCKFFCWGLVNAFSDIIFVPV